MKQFLLIILFFAALLSGCKKYYVNGVDLKTPDWTEATHSNSVAPDYAVVFEEGKVNRFDIVISSADWTSMQNDLRANVQPGNPPPPVSDTWQPLYVPCSFRFNGKEWYKVGIRYKDNSSLKYCINTGIKKYSFKLNFDHFEDQFTPIKNQRFYGFKELSLGNNFSDPSMMREKTSVDLFRQFGVIVSHAVFCEVWVDYGLGAKYFGLYTLEEEVDDSVIKTKFATGGNLYKPDGIAATFALGTFSNEQFYKKTNLVPEDYSDIRSLYNIINSESRIVNYGSWKNALEDILDVPQFLKWLASNTVIQDWDTYGLEHHNYYLYNNPSSGKLTWIPWDNSASFLPGSDKKTALSLSLDEVTEGWPLIRYLMDDADYKANYRSCLSAFVQNPFTVASVSAMVDSQVDLIRQYATKEIQGFTFLSSPTDFENGVSYIKQHVQTRVDAVTLFLSK
jgi:spore coat protein H